MVLPDGRGFPVTLRQGNRDISNCDIRGISEDRQGNIWLATDNEGIICVVKPDGRHARMTVRQYSPQRQRTATITLPATASSPLRKTTRVTCG